MPAPHAPADATEYAAPLVRGEPVEVADRVYVIPDQRVPLVPNIGIVVGDRAALVIDTGAGPGNGAHVREVARELADGLPLYLALTQLDPGHGFGAQAFKGHATIVYSEAQRDRSRHHAPAYITTFRGMGRAVAGQLDGMELVEPDVTYQDEYEIDLGGVRAVLRQWGPAHTADDQTVLIDRRVLFAGDLLQDRMFPILPYFPPFDTHFDGDRWIEALDELIALDIETVVPGHGDITGTQHMREVREYLSHVHEKTASARARGVPFDTAVEGIEKHALARWPDWEVPGWITYAAFAYYHDGGGVRRTGAQERQDEAGQ
ncbi:MBL fold metallo-hydrolase [Streptomyces sp. NPDC048290]|uniref:MBL fold metallo-hydrolase n=1 Tax=Streptomyces sp. NPDC048290 TaxID=3155811 RepID=UPI00342054C4